MNIAIIGAGLSGSNVLKTILEHPRFSQDDQIDVFEPREYLSTGMPYAPDDHSALLNSKPEKLSVNENDKADFIKWLKNNGEEPKNDEGLISRPQYGQYLSERFESYYNHPQVTHIQERVIDMEVKLKNTKEGMYQEGEITAYQLETEKGIQNKNYRAVFFAIGHPPYKDDYHLIGAENYIHSPYPLKEELRDLKNHQKIGIIGAGAASVDYYRFLTKNYQLEHPLTFYVQNHAFYFPSIPYEDEAYTITLSKEWIANEKRKNEGFIPFDRILHTIEKDLKKSDASLSHVYKCYQNYELEDMEKVLDDKDQELALVQAYISDIGPLLPHLFNALNATERDLYLLHYHEKLLFFRNLIPYKTMIHLVNDLQAGKIRVVYGSREMIPQKSDNRFKVIADEIEYADVLINGTGFQNNLVKAAQQDPLIQNLYRKKLISAHREGRYILVEWPQVRMMNQRFGVMENAFFLGSYIRGTHFENNNAVTIIAVANFVAKKFMDDLKK